MKYNCFEIVISIDTFVFFTHSDAEIVKKYLAEISLTIVTIVVIALSIQSNETKQSTHSTELTVEIPEPRMVWGLPFDSLHIDTFQVKRNQHLSNILTQQNVSAAVIDKLARNFKAVFDVRKIKSGNTYYIINTDSTNPPEFFVYDESAIDYIVYNIDSISAYRGKKQIDTIQKATAGVISNSLWNTFVENNSTPTLALDLSDIFAWTIDFFGIQNGDEYKVIYDELYVEDKFIGIGHIHAASIIHMGDTVSAFYYDDEEQQGYFDTKGESLRKAFLKAPLKFSRISSRFSNSRMHPVLKIRRPHRGVDYAAPIGTPVYSIGDGTIVKKAYQKGGGGNYLNIKHNSVYTSQYMHLNAYAKGIATGVRVKQGQLIGYVGKTGLASGPHLDFRIYKNGTPVDPLKVKAPPVEPIKEEYRTIYTQVRDSLMNELLDIQVIRPTEEPLAAEQ